MCLTNDCIVLIFISIIFGPGAQNIEVWEMCNGCNSISLGNHDVLWSHSRIGVTHAQESGTRNSDKSFVSKFDASIWYQKYLQQIEQECITYTQVTCASFW